MGACVDRDRAQLGLAVGRAVIWAAGRPKAPHRIASRRRRSLTHFKGSSRLAVWAAVEEGGVVVREGNADPQNYNIAPQVLVPLSLLLSPARMRFVHTSPTTYLKERPIILQILRIVAYTTYLRPTGPCTAYWRDCDRVRAARSWRVTRGLP